MEKDSNTTLFIADLHLDASRPELTSLALRFLDTVRGAEALWIMGDLFEAWLGDDTLTPAMKPLVTALSQVSSAGTQVHLMHGNRDFLLGEAFAEQVGAQLHREDEHVLVLGGVPHLLLHGDTLCTGDTDYLKLRQMLRAPAWQADFLARTPAERVEAARALREQSREAVSAKHGHIMDVEPEAVNEAFTRQQCQIMIHGHTHRPADHHDDSAGTRRVVVGDWHADHAQFARHDGHALTLETWR